MPSSAAGRRARTSVDGADQRDLVNSAGPEIEGGEEGVQWQRQPGQDQPENRKAMLPFPTPMVSPTPACSAACQACSATLCSCSSTTWTTNHLFLA
jgi:hypothetical protein